MTMPDRSEGGCYAFPHLSERVSLGRRPGGVALLLLAAARDTDTVAFAALDPPETP